MEEKIFNWAELIEHYDDNGNQTFEEYFCDQLSIKLVDFHTLNKVFRDYNFRVRPNYDYIQWRGSIDSDFTVRVDTEKFVPQIERLRYKYIIQSRESGDFICGFDTLEEAKAVIARYEEDDKQNGCHIPDFYEIVED